MGSESLEVGRRVRLLPNEEEGWEEQFGVVVGVPGLAGDPYLVRLDEDYRDARGQMGRGSSDDGLREVTPDQLEPIGPAARAWASRLLHPQENLGESEALELAEHIAAQGDEAGFAPDTVKRARAFARGR